MQSAEGGTSVTSGEATIDSWETAAEGAAAMLASWQPGILPSLDSQYQLGFKPKEVRLLLMLAGGGAWFAWLSGIRWEKQKLA